MLPLRCMRIQFRNLSNQITQTSLREKWDLLSAVCLERKPVTTRNYNEIEMKVSKLLQELEFEGSHKSNFELRLESDKKRAKDLKEGNVSISDIDSAPQQTGEDFLDLCREEFKTFELAPRKGDHLTEEDPKSFKRALDRNLVLIIKENVGKKPLWVLPQGKHQTGETLRETAERVLKEKCGHEIIVKFIGNAPCGFYKYRYPKSVRKGDIVGAKMFFFKAQLIEGPAKADKYKCPEFQWVTRPELETLPYDYLKSIKMFLIDEEH